MLSKQKGASGGVVGSGSGAQSHRGLARKKDGLIGRSEGSRNGVGYLPASGGVAAADLRTFVGIREARL